MIVSVGGPSQVARPRVDLKSPAQQAQRAPGDSAQISATAKMFAQLSDLQKSDPNRFRQLTAQMSDKLSEAAKSTANPEVRKSLNDLSAQFKKASETGDLNSVQPPGGGPPGGGPTAGGPSGGGPGGGPGGGAASGDRSTKVYHPADTNKDGYVSGDEAAAYSARMAQKAAKPGGSAQAKAQVHQAVTEVFTSVRSSLQ